MKIILQEGQANPIEFVQRLRELMDSQDMSQAQLCKAAGLGAGYLSNLLNGYFGTIGAEKYQAIKNALGCTDDDLGVTPIESEWG